MLRSATCAVLVVAVLCCLAGCSKRQRTITTPEGEKATVETDRSGDKTKITVETDEGEKGTMEIDASGDKAELTIKSEEGEGKMKFSEDADVSGLGVEIYPGAKSQGSSTLAMGQGQMRTASLATADSFDKVAKFYRDKYAAGAKTVMEQPASLTIVREEEKQNVSISVTRDDEKKQTVIGITVVPKTQ